MEIATIIALLPYLTTILTSAIAIYKAVKAKRFSDALTLSDETLRTVATAIELLPQSEHTAAVKKQISELANAAGVQGPKLLGLVRDIERLFKANDITPIIATENNAVVIEDNIRRSAIAVGTARAMRANVALAKERTPKTRKTIRALSILMLLAALLFCVGCAAAPPERVTTEVVWPATAGDPAEIAVVWPAGVLEGDVITQDVEGRAVSTAPMYTVTRPRP